MFNSLLELIGRYGYVVVALFVSAEGVGLPLPGESALVLAAAAAAQGRLSLAGVVCAGALGAVLGGSAGYWVGRIAGLALLERPSGWLGIRPNRIERARRFFERYGPATVFLARFVAFFRTLVCPLAGASGMAFGRFTAFNALGGVLWATAVAGVSYFLGESLPRLQRGIGRAGLALALLVALMVSLVLAWRWFQAHSDSIAARAWRLWDRLAELHPRARAFLTARFAPGQYLGLHLTIGLAYSLIGLWIFGAITEGVVEPGGLTRFDAALATWLRARAGPAGDTVWGAVSDLGSPAAIGVVTLGVAAVLALRRRWTELATWLGAVTGGSALNLGLKVLIQRPRPPAAGLGTLGFSFPSGHAMASLVCYGLLAYLIVLHTKRRGLRVAAVAVASGLVLAIGFSRLYLGLHYFSDVVGGYAAAMIWLVACISGLEIAQRCPPRLATA